MNAFSPAQFRAQFPALADAGIYLDSAATALKPQAVIEATRQFYSLSAGNVHRSQYADAQRLTAQYEAARDQVARLINADSGKNIVWTRGTTEAINMVAQCYARPLLQPGDEIIVKRGGRLGRQGPTIRAFAGDPNLYYEPFGAIIPGLAHQEIRLLQQERVT